MLIRYRRQGDAERHQREVTQSVYSPSDTRTRVCCPPRAFSIRWASCTMLTQYPASGDSNSAGILVPLSAAQAELTRGAVRAEHRVAVVVGESVGNFTTLRWRSPPSP